MRQTRESRGLPLPSGAQIVVIAAVIAVAGLVWMNYGRVAEESESQIAENAVSSLTSVEALVKRGPAALPVLLEAVDSPDAKERRLALFGMGRLGPAAATAIGKIQGRLTDDDAKVRENAAAAVARVCPEDAARHIAPLLADRESSVRSTAGKELVRIGPTALPVMEEWLHNEQPSVRLEVVRILRSTFNYDAQYNVKWYSSSDKVNAAIRGAVADPDHAVHFEAVTVAAQYGETTSDEVRELLQTGVWEHRQIALSAVPKLGDESAQFLVEVLALLDDDTSSDAVSEENRGRDFSPFIPTHLEFALKILGGMKHVARPASGRLAEIAAPLRDRTLLMSIVHTMQRIGADEAEIFQVLMPMLCGSERDLAWNAGQLLGKDYPEEAQRQVGLMIPKLGTNETSVDKSILFAIYALGKQAPEAVGALIPLLNNRDKWVAEFAAHALGEIGLGSVKGVPELVAIVANPNSSLKQRWACARALSDIGPNVRSAVPTLLELIARPEPETRPPVDRFGVSEWEIRALIIKALGNAGEDDPDVMRAVQAQLGSTSIPVRAAALSAMGQVAPHSNEVMAELILRLRDVADECRIAAANSIAMMQVDRRVAVKPLISLLADEEYAVAAAAANALGKLGKDAHDALATLRELVADPNYAVGDREPHVLRATKAAIRAIEADLAAERQ